MAGQVGMQVALKSARVVQERQVSEEEQVRQGLLHLAHWPW